MSLSIDQSQNLLTNSFIKISQEELRTNNKLDAKLRQAALQGFFYLEMPEDCKQLVNKAVGYANAFHADTSVKDLQLEGLSGYYDRSNYQVESLYIEKKYWQNQLPNELSLLAPKMHRLALDVLKKTLSMCNISKENYAKATGNVSEEGGNVYFVFNHYRPDKPRVGLESHQDFGQITVLFINQLGLEAKINDEWVSIPPVENHFVINFGRALEISVNDSKKLTAAFHRVQQVFTDRISFGIFADNDDNSMMYKQTMGGELESLDIVFEKYIKTSFAEYHPD